MIFHSNIRLITEVGDWCSTINQMVEKARQQLVEEVMSSTSPAMMKFVKSDHSMLLDKNKIGFFTVSGPIRAEICSQKRELSTIKEEEVRVWFSQVNLILNTPGEWSYN